MGVEPERRSVMIFKLIKYTLFGAMLLALGACGMLEGDERANTPIPGSLVSKMNSMNSSASEAMLVRIFKEDSELEVWKRTRDGTYKFLKSYEICSWSGEVGPKIREGDRQSPEGFYTVTPGLMNPKSSYYLAFNTGFPNKFDRVHGRTGSDLMVHGDCSSRGCFAMTDEQIAEIFAIARDAFRGGQREFQLQIYPFRMTAENLARHRDSEHLDFWRNLKIGYDAFEMSNRLPEWDVCEKRYIFNPESNGRLDPAGTCPATYSSPQLMAEVMAKQVADDRVFETRVASIEQDLAEQEARRIKREQEAAAGAARTAAINAAVAERTNVVGNVVSGFFAGIFGGGREQTAQINPDLIAPIPFPPPGFPR